MTSKFTFPLTQPPPFWRPWGGGGGGKNYLMRSHCVICQSVTKSVIIRCQYKTVIIFCNVFFGHRVSYTVELAVHHHACRTYRGRFVPTFWTLLTLLLPRCHLRTTNKRTKFETLKPFCLLFRTDVRKDFH